MSAIHASPNDLAPGPHGRLDAMDLRILRALREDARRSARSIAREIGAAPGTVAERVRRLEEDGVIRGYTIDLDPEHAGLRLSALLGVRISQRAHVQDVIAHLRSFPWVESVWAVTGQWDLFVLVHVRDQRHLLDIVQSEVWTAPGFTHNESLVVLMAASQPAAWLDGLSEVQDVAG